MKIVFVRHGHPDYTTDTLTDEGKEQAIACAERLKDLNISKIYSSPNGRAKETAAYTAKLIDREVVIKDFMHEISWGAVDGDKSRVYIKEGSHDQGGGHPWDTVEFLAEEEGISLIQYQDWRNYKYFKHNKAVECVNYVTTEFRAFMKELGYEKKEGNWTAVSPREETIAIFSHGGSGAAMMSELLGFPFPYICLAFTMNFTSITIFDLPVSDRIFVTPRIEKINDDLHVKSKQITYSN